MKLWINIESDYSADASTLIEVPDDAAPGQISEVIRESTLAGKVNYPDLLDAERICSTMTVWRTDSDGEPLEDGCIDECEESW